MYLKFYQLESEPFHITPDPEYLFLSPSHKEALASVLYGVERRKGFIALTGEVGTGKTTVIRAFLEHKRPNTATDAQIREASNATPSDPLEPVAGAPESRLVPICLLNSALSFDELMRTILKQLHIDARSMTVAEMVNRLHWALIAAYRRGHNVVLFIDEAQNMPVETLEALRMLSNLETHTDKLIQIVLAGQPELEEKLSLHALRQFRQRIAVRARLELLTRKESVEYIEHRLAKAALLPGRVFSDAALRFIARSGRGCPRALNIICDNALIAGYGSHEKPVSAKLARRVVSELGLASSRRARPAWIAFGGIAACLLLALAAAFAFGPRISADEDLRSAHVSPPQEAAGVLQAAELSPTPATQAIPLAEQDSVVPANPEAPALDESPMQNDPAFADLLGEQSDVVPDALQEVVVASEAPTPAPKEEKPARDAEAQAQIRQVLPGETLSGIAREVYGSANEDTLGFILEHNPQITSHDLIVEGDKLKLPGRRAEVASVQVEGMT